MADLDNPYQPPASLVADVLDDTGPEGSYIEGGRAVTSGRGSAWLGEGWSYFRRHAGMWIVLTIIFSVLLIAINMVPSLGWLASTLLGPVFVAGLMTGCQTVSRGGDLELAHLFAGFRRNTGQLMLVGVIGFVLTLVAVVPLVFMLGVGFFLGRNAGSSFPLLGMGMGVVLAVLVSLALFVPVNMAMWFASALVMLQDQSAPRAIGQSFRGCLKNVVPFLIYGVIVCILAVLATIPFALGWFVLGPVVLCSVYAAYRDIFFTT